MLTRKLVLFLIICVGGLFAAGSWSAPVPKEKPDAKTLPQEEAVEAVDAVGIPAARNRATSMNHLKQCALAVHNYVDAVPGKDRFPQNIVDQNGKPLLSWRVLLLPHLALSEKNLQLNGNLQQFFERML